MLAGGAIGRGLSQQCYPGTTTRGRRPWGGRLGSSPTRPDPDPTRHQARPDPTSSPTRPDPDPTRHQARPDPDRAKEKATRRSPEFFWFPLLRLSSTVPVIIG